jgi:hypothetical protein
VRLVAKDGRNGVLDIEVDRGVATYPQPLPGEDDRAGWGATEGRSAYTSIAALPSATVAVRQGDDELGRVRWGDVERDGRADAGQVSFELVEGGRNWVHVRVVDDATGRPVPCRVHFRSAAGIPYQPHGHHNHVTQNLDSWHYDVGGDVRLGQRSLSRRASFRPHLSGLPRLRRRRLDDDRPRRHPLYANARRGGPRIRTAYRGPEV